MAFMIRRAEPSDWEAYRACWRCYRAYRFVETGRRRTMDRDPAITEIELGYPLSN
jgi:hypothetical protein